MDSLNKVTVHASEVISARDTIQTPYSEFNVGSNLPKISEADIAKLAKRQEKEEKQRRAALAQHQVLAMSLFMKHCLQTSAKGMQWPLAENIQADIRWHLKMSGFLAHHNFPACLAASTTCSRALSYEASTLEISCSEQLELQLCGPCNKPV